jgi:hypothetical protein
MKVLVKSARGFGVQNATFASPAIRVQLVE